MDGGSRDSNPQTTSEDEANKRNTDCVYFLASPLTCIKGADCEYRHSENARVNPRDCWFWLNGNCLNPKCAFRHPPLDGFRGVSTDASLGASLPPSQPAIPAQAPHYASTPYHAASYTSSKQKVPCYYFQKGLCLKGDKCPFMHGSQPAGDPTLVQTSKTDPVSDPQSDKKTMNGTENPTSQKRNTPQSFASRAAEAAPITKTDGKKGALPSVGNTFQKNRTPANVVDKPIRFTQAAVVVPSRNASAKPRLRPSQSQDERFQNGKDVDECLGESSPGFDVLVDDDLEEEYFDADMERAPGHGGRHLNSQQEIDRVGSGTDTFGEFVGEHGKLEPYDIYGRKQDQFGWEQSRAPAERVLERSSMTERRVLSREEIPAQKKEQDLRHQLSKRRRVNESRAVNGSNNHGDLYRKDDQFVEDRYRRHSRQENLQHASTEGSLSKRLHGRIKFPERPPEFSSEPYSDVELEQRKMRGRSSPSRAGLHLGKNCEKVRGRTDEDIATEGGSFRGQAARSEERKLESLDFAGPKSLAQLKGAKISETHEEQNVVSSANRQPLKSQVVHGEGEKRMRPRKCSIQDSSVSLSFEGPKPLSELLKRKRETSSGHNGEPRKEENQMERTHGNSDVTDLQTPVAKSAERKKEAADGSSRSPISAGTDPDKLDSTDEVHPFTNDGSPTEADCNAQEEEDALMLDTEDQVEGNLEKDRESEDAGIEENLDAEDEYEDDEDGDDFARKLGVMFS